MRAFKLPAHTATHVATSDFQAEFLTKLLYTHRHSPSQTGGSRQRMASPTLLARPILLSTNHPFSPTPALVLPPRPNPPPQAVLTMATEGGPGLNGAEASGMARIISYPPPHPNLKTLNSYPQIPNPKPKPFDIEPKP